MEMMIPFIILSVLLVLLYLLWASDSNSQDEKIANNKHSIEDINTRLTKCHMDAMERITELSKNVFRHTDAIQHNCTHDGKIGIKTVKRDDYGNILLYSSVFGANIPDSYNSEVLVCGICGKEWTEHNDDEFLSMKEDYLADQVLKTQEEMLRLAELEAEDK